MSNKTENIAPLYALKKRNVLQKKVSSVVFLWFTAFRLVLVGCLRPLFLLIVEEKKPQLKTFYFAGFSQKKNSVTFTFTEIALERSALGHITLK